VTRLAVSLLQENPHALGDVGGVGRLRPRALSELQRDEEH
jgi:hypothetical protein